MFECHVTIALEHGDLGQQVASALHWSTSEIERDPLLGKASYFYLTTHDTDLVRMTTRMRECVDALQAIGVPVVREKIEVIIHDTKKKGVPASLSTQVFEGKLIGR